MALNEMQHDESDISAAFEEYVRRHRMVPPKDLPRELHVESPEIQEESEEQNVWVEKSD